MYAGFSLSHERNQPDFKNRASARFQVAIQILLKRWDWRFRAQSVADSERTKGAATLPGLRLERLIKKDEVIDFVVRPG